MSKSSGPGPSGRNPNSSKGSSVDAPPAAGTSHTRGSHLNRTESQGSVDKRKEIIRRRAVAAETYNPEEDADYAPVKHPKTEAQRKRLEGYLKEIVIMQKLEREQLDEILDAFFIKNVKAGDFIIKQGDEGDFYYVIDSGKYNAFSLSNGEQTLIKQYDGSGSFGELALMYSQPRAASVQAATEGTIWALDRKTFRRIVGKSHYKSRKLYEQLIKNFKLLSHLNDFERTNLSDVLLVKNFSDGSVIMKEGDEADGMYFVISGIVAIYKMKNKKNTLIKSVEKGGYFGELALMTKGRRAATAIAKGNVSCAFLDTEAFERLMGPCVEEMKNNIAKYGIKVDEE